MDTDQKQEVTTFFFLMRKEAFLHIKKIIAQWWLAQGWTASAASLFEQLV